MIFAFLAESIIFCVIAVVFLNALSVSYTGLVNKNNTELINLYTSKVEAQMKQVVDLSYSILCDSAVQRSVKKYNSSIEDYNRFNARTELYNILYAKTFNMSFIESIHFIYQDEYQINVNPKQPHAIFEPAYLNSLKAEADQRNGGNVWSVDENRTQTIEIARLYRNIDVPFEPLGYLIISVRSDAILEYESKSAAQYTPQVFCSIGDVIIRDPNTSIDKLRIGEILDSKADTGTIAIDQANFIFAVNESRLIDWRFVILMNSDLIFQEVQARRSLYLISLVVVCLVILFLVARYASLIYRPISTLADYIRMIPAGVFRHFPNSGKNRSMITEIALLAENYNHMADKIDYLINEVHQEELRLSEMRYKMLQNQINPHFLYNTLETIRWKAKQSGDDEIGEMTLAISNLLRISISKSDIVTLSDDIRLANNYIKIQKIRYEDRLEYEQNIDESLSEYCLPKLSLQPLIENSIQHNLEKHKGICKIKVSTVRLDTCYLIVVKDNGRVKDLEQVHLVMQGEKESTGTGLGLKNIHERIQISFGSAYGLRVFTEDGYGICVELRLPYMTLKEYEDRNATNNDDETGRNHP